VKHAQALGRTPREPARFSYVPGRGINAVVTASGSSSAIKRLMTYWGISVPQELLERNLEGSEVFVACDSRLLGAIAIADTVAPNLFRRLPRHPVARHQHLLLTVMLRPLLEVSRHSSGSRSA